MKKNTKNHSSKDFHAINNLLAHISLSAEVLLQEIPGTLNSEQKKYTKAILSECKKIKNMLKD